jgi:hypothetical protein
MAGPDRSPPGRSPGGAEAEGTPRGSGSRAGGGGGEGDEAVVGGGERHGLMVSQWAGWQCCRSRGGAVFALQLGWEEGEKGRRPRACVRA